MYGSVAVVQAHTVGMHRSLTQISEALQELLGSDLTAIYSKSRDTLPGQYATTTANSYLFGESTGNHEVTENGRKFAIDWEQGQKTGFFLDQRENRVLLAHYSAGKTVLNAFCYSGGFSVYALSAGAKEVVSIDVSGKATVLCDTNVALNGFSENHTSLTEDVMKWLKTSPDTYDIVVLDPPAFSICSNASSPIIVWCISTWLSTDPSAYLVDSSVRAISTASEIAMPKLPGELGSSARILRPASVRIEGDGNTFPPQVFIIILR